MIRSIIHITDGTGRFFPKTVEMEITPGKAYYDLPSDCYAINSINEIFIQSDSSIFLQSGQLKQITSSERSVKNGYYPYGRQIRLSYEPYTGGKMKINYTVKIPSLSPRCLRVKSYANGKIRAERDSFDPAFNILDYSDSASIVDRKGNILHCELDLSQYNQETGTVTIEGEVPPIGEGATIEPGGYLVLGEVASSHSMLPEETHHLLTTLVERRIKGIDSEPDSNRVDYLAAEERTYIEELFGDSGNDARSTPLGDDNYLAW